MPHPQGIKVKPTKPIAWRVRRAKAGQREVYRQVAEACARSYAALQACTIPPLAPIADEILLAPAATAPVPASRTKWTALVLSARQGVVSLLERAALALRGTR